MSNTQSTTAEPFDFTTKPAPMLGWICPVCGSGMSPFATKCPCKMPPLNPTLVGIGGTGVCNTGISHTTLTVIDYLNMGT